MAMFECRLAYRHLNGEVEGFHACSFQGFDTSKRLVILKIIDKCNAMMQVYDPTRVITGDAGLSESEMKTIRDDWKLDMGFNNH
jgi:hypothetical protein